MALKLEQARQIVELLDDGSTVYEDYSGRGMYGRTCVGIVTDSPEQVGWAAGQLGIPRRDLPKRRDSMGLSVILY